MLPYKSFVSFPISSRTIRKPIFTCWLWYGTTDRVLNQSMQQHFRQIHRFFSSLYTTIGLFWRICCLLERCADLEQLEGWAKRKRLVRPRYYYQSLLREIEFKLLVCRRATPLVVCLAEFGVTLYHQLSSSEARRYYIGHGMRYRMFSPR